MDFSGFVTNPEHFCTGFILPFTRRWINPKLKRPGSVSSPEILSPKSKESAFYFCIAFCRVNYSSSESGYFSARDHTESKAFLHVLYSCTDEEGDIIWQCLFSMLLSIGGSHCRHMHVGVQNKRKFVHIVCIKMEVKSQRRKILLFMYTNMAAMTSHANHQYKLTNSLISDIFVRIRTDHS